MSVIIPPGYGEAAWVFTSNEGTAPFVCTMGVNLTGAGGAYTTAANDLFAMWATTILLGMDSDLILDRCVLTVGQDGPSGSVQSSISAVAGGRSAEGLPWSMSAIARKQSGALGRRGRGRMFIPGLVSPAEIGQGGQIAAPRRIVIDGLLDDFYEALTSEEASNRIYPPVLLHSPGGPSTPTPVTALSCAPLVGWVRKRIR